MAKIRNRYNHVPHLTQDTVWESDKYTRKHQIQNLAFPKYYLSENLANPQNTTHLWTSLKVAIIKKLHVCRSHKT